ncbi:hypothetical protein BS78_03G004300 [Paspalum vaginatum]|nr:hypothetical protein BS78_03G004300 [Paspalum vaginatum]
MAAHVITLGSPQPTSSQQRSTRRRRLLLIVVSIVSLALAVATAVSLTILIAVRRSRPAPGTEAITRACGATLYPELCISELTDFTGAADADLVPVSLNATRQRVEDALSSATALVGARPTAAAAAYSDCLDMLDIAGELLKRSVSRATGSAPTGGPAAAADADSDRAEPKHNRRDDVMTWLSAALTYYDTCRDGLQRAGADDEDGRIKAQMVQDLGNLGEHLSNSLAIFKARSRFLGSSGDDFPFPPRWVKHGDRGLLQVAAGADDIVPDMVVAKDGSGTHLSISDAVEAAPEKSSRRVVIYVKAGTYEENVQVGLRKTNLMLMGAGADKTAVVGRRSVADGMRTFDTATVSVTGDGFMMRDMTVENRAGPASHQAVALLVSADHAVVYRCAVLGYQDTLYAHAQRQFYRDCEVAGTVDVVFGNAAAVLQNCTLRARRPLPGQKNTVTAQGRADPNQSTGTSVHACRLLPSPEYPTTTYLGRPWKPYSRVVYMMSDMAGHVDAAGWLAWDASGRAPDSTVYYGEYQNSGPGAAVQGRLEWPGHHVITSAAEAMAFTVGRFIGGRSWLPYTGAAFVAGLAARDE